MVEIKIPKIDDKLAEETGWHIGDGSMNFYKNKGVLRGLYQLRGHIEDDKEHYIYRIKPIFKELYRVEISLRDMPSTRVFGFQIWSDELVNFKKSIGIKLGRKIDIEIPKIFLTNDKLKISVIRGIFDTDGGIYLERKNNKLYPRIEIRTISKKLADQLLINLIKLGFRTTIHSELLNKVYDRRRSYVVSVRGGEMFIKWMNIIRPKNIKHIIKFDTYRKSFK